MSIDPESITAVILAGGFGTRVKHLLGDLPKPMAPVNGRPFVEWILRYLAKKKIRCVILSTGYQAEKVNKHFQSQPANGVRANCVPETVPLGTAGGFLNAIGATPKQSPLAWLVLNGDSLALAPLEQMIHSLNPPGVSGVILGVRVADASRYGTVSFDADHTLTGFNEKKPGAGVINAGLYLLKAGVVAQFPTKMPLSFETDVFQALIKRGVRLKVCVTDAPFLDIGTPESLSQAESFIRQNQQEFVL